MAKMFYSEEEAAAKLGITTDELENRAKRGELERLMNLNKPVYKVVQIDMLAGGRTRRHHRRQRANPDHRLHRGR